MRDREEFEEYEEESPKPKQKKHLLYRLFNGNGNGKELLPEPEGPDNIVKCFKIYKRNITRLLYVNLIIIFGNFPLLLGLYGISGAANGKTMTAASELFGPLHGAMLHSKSPVSLALFGIHGGQTSASVYTTTTYVLIALSLLVVFTFGIINTGTAYLLRGMVRRDPIFFWSDFKGAIKKNFKQAFVLGIIDCLAIFCLIYGAFFYYINGMSMFYIALVLFAIYTMMRFYIYPLMITFDLTVWKILKNACIFAVLGFKRNVMAFLGCVLMFGFEYLLLGFYYPVGVVFPLGVMFSTCAYFGMFAAWPKIKEVMIDPYMENK